MAGEVECSGCTQEGNLSGGVVGAGFAAHSPWQTLEQYKLGQLFSKSAHDK